MKNNNINTLVMSAHAKKRWDERFISIDLNYEWRNATKATKAQHKRIKSSCGNTYDKKTASYFVSPCGCVFVISGNTIITVLFLYD